MYVACEGLSDLDHGPNEPTETIIGEYSASYHHGAHIFTLVIQQQGLFSVTYNGFLMFTNDCRSKLVGSMAKV